MKLYGRKFADRSMFKKVRVRSETRDAILWNVDWDNRICNVKIQGSNELVAAHFPQNLAAHDPFMKPGNAVKVLHRGGVRGYVELIGHGMAIPTPVAGDSHPGTSDLADGVITGMETNPTDPLTLGVEITSGTYRINEVVYTLTPGSFGIFMSTSDPMVMNAAYPPAVMGDTTISKYKMTDPTTIVMSATIPPMTMGEVVGDYELDAVPAGNKFRYDCFYVGVDGVIHYLKGAEVSSNPVKPSIPADTVLIGQYILLWTGMTEVTGQHIGMDWSASVVSGLDITADDEFDWDFGDDTPEMNVAVEVQDQYGFPISGVYTIMLSFLMGTGLLWSGDSGYDTTVQQQFSGSSYTFKYERNQLVSEASPYILISEQDHGLIGACEITLLDQWDNPIEGGGAGDVQYLTSAANVTVDWSEGVKANITIDQDVTFAFTGTPEMEKLILKIIQDGTGGWVITLPANVRYGAEITAAVVSTGIGTRSYLGFLYDADDDEYDLVANVSDYD